MPYIPYTDEEKQLATVSAYEYVETLLSELERLHHHYEQQPLPVTRQEFENRSMLYHILEDMKAFLDIKKDFITAR